MKNLITNRITENTTTAVKEGKTMKNTRNIRTRIIAATLSAISIMSAMSVMSSAADMTTLETPVAGTYGEHEKTEYNHDITVITPEYTRLQDEEINSRLSGLSYNEDTENETSTADKTMETIAKGIIEGGLDILGDAFPGAKILSSILGGLIGQATEGEDPIASLADQEQKHFEELSGKIAELDKNMEQYTDKLELIIDTGNKKESLSQLFTKLSTNLKDLTDKIKSINDVKEYTPEQKLVLIANLNYDKSEKNYLVEVRDAADAISKALKEKGRLYDSNGNLLANDMYATLVNICKGEGMFQGEAYNKAMDTAKALTEQYMYANAVLLECQNASRQLNFNEDQVKALGSDQTIIDAYKYCIRPENKNFQDLKFKDTVTRLKKGVDSFINFDKNKGQNNIYTNFGKQKTPIVLDFGLNWNDHVTTDNLKEIYDGQFFKGDKINEFLDYINKTAGGQQMSIADFLKANGQKVLTAGSDGTIQIHISHKDTANTGYIVVDPKITTTKKHIKHKDATQGGYCCDPEKNWYECTETIKVIDINDPERKVQEIVIRTYTRLDEGYKNNPSSIRASNIVDYAVNLLKIGSHEATERDDLNWKPNAPKIDPNNKLDIKGPTIDPNGPKINGPKVGK